MQLIRPGVEMLDPIKQKPIGPAEVMEKFGVAPDKMIDVQALIGDSRGQRAGRAGHRPEDRGATASTNTATWKPCWPRRPAMKPSKRRDMLIEHAEKARMSRELVTLRDDAPLPMPIETLHARQPEPAKLARLADGAGLPQHRHAGWGWRTRRRRRTPAADARAGPRRGAQQAAARCCEPARAGAADRSAAAVRSV